MAGSAPTSVPRRLNRAEILAVFTSAKSCVDGIEHIESAREAVLWIIDPHDAEEREFRYRCVLAASPFRTGRMTPKRFTRIYLDFRDQVNTIDTLIRPKKKAAPAPKPTPKPAGRKKTT